MDRQEQSEHNNLLILDKIFPQIPQYGSHIISMPLGLDFQTEKGFVIPNHGNDLLKNYGYANIVFSDSGEFYISELTDKGRAAQQAGGHFAYIKKIADKEQKEQERQHRKDRIDQVDFLTKTWAYKFRHLLYIASFGGLAVSIFTYLKPDKESKNLESMKLELQEVKDKMVKLDTLFRLDTFLKRDTLHILKHQ